MKYFQFVILVLYSLIFVRCADDEDESYSPKPRGYYRIQFPEKKYQMYDSVCPYKFEYPVYGKIERDKHPMAEPCWINVQFPYFRATLHLSYKDMMNKKIADLIEDSRELAIKHQIKSTGMEETVILRDSVKVYGLIYDIEGNTASSLQFYVTDSTKHFIRGALYFNVKPNIDSVKIVLEFLKADVLHLIQTLQWKNVDKK
jgi:gliding motility-associated lipoprotein GldD